MSRQPEFFDNRDIEGYPSSRSLPHNHTPTSKAAAKSMEGKAATQRGDILRFLAERGEQGATAFEVEQLMHISGNSVRPRLVELRASGAVVAAGFTRKTGSGRAAVVWRVA